MKQVQLLLHHYHELICTRGHLIQWISWTMVILPMHLLPAELGFSFDLD